MFALDQQRIAVQCNDGKPHTSPCTAKKGEQFYREEKIGEGYSKLSHWISLDESLPEK